MFYIFETLKNSIPFAQIAEKYWISTMKVMWICYINKDKSTLSSYLKKLSFRENDRVEYVSIDMNDHNRDIASIYFRNATIVADSYHIVKHIHDALDGVRRRIMKRYKEKRKAMNTTALIQRRTTLSEGSPFRRA